VLAVPVSISAVAVLRQMFGLAKGRFSGEYWGHSASMTLRRPLGSASAQERIRLVPGDIVEDAP
jgi:hypothetical protein